MRDIYLMERKAVLFPLLGGILFPHSVLKTRVGPEAHRAVHEAQRRGGIGIAAAVEDKRQGGPIRPADLPLVAVLVRLDDVSEHGSSMDITLSGLVRVHLQDILVRDGFWEAEFEFWERVRDIDADTEKALIDSIVQISTEILDLMDVHGSVRQMLHAFTQAEPLIDMVLQQLPLTVAQKQELLEIPGLKDLALTTLDHLARQRESIALQKELNRRIGEQAGRHHRENLLREQLRAIQDQLNEGKPRKDYRTRLQECGLPPAALEEALEELERMETMGPGNPEYTVLRNWIDLVVDLPWKDTGVPEIDLGRARSILDEDHFGLDKVKERILQFLAVLKLNPQKRGALLLLVGPPGVGKTSLGRSIARATGREFIRASLGGVRDEADIRGHRRTYIGALPGRILRSLKRAKTKSPVFLLDEIDKLAKSWNGDPAAALLEVLDPEQNAAFVDHFLDLPFDLSQVFFIATANSTETIPPPLLDRMERIDLPGYTEREKREIAVRHLWPRALEDHGLEHTELVLGDGVVEAVIRGYTREAGVRELQRKLAALVRGSAEKVLQARLEGTAPVVIPQADLPKILGREVVPPEPEPDDLPPGVALGLAWTPTGGEILYIETAALDGDGKVVLTGQLGDVMKESAQLALSLVRLLVPFPATGNRFRQTNWNIHVPAGAIPKDGPSAGVAILTALASLVTGRRVDPHLAMTGEITLRGAVLPVGGIKEKVLAAHRAGIEKVLLPARNELDWMELPPDVRENLRVVFVDRVGQVLREALGLEVPDWPRLFNSANSGNRADRPKP